VSSPNGPASNSDPLFRRPEAAAQRPSKDARPGPRRLLPSAPPAKPSGCSARPRRPSRRAPSGACTSGRRIGAEIV